MNYFADENEWKWLFEKGVDWNKIISLYYPELPNEDGLESPEEVLDFLKEAETAIGQWCGTSLTELADKLDKVGCGEVRDGKTILNEYLQRIYQEGAELQLFGLNAPREYAGLNAPYILNIMNLAFISRASLSACAQLSFFNSMIEMIERFCSKEFRDKWIPQVIAGKASGCMIMTEPDCGSDLGAMKTLAKKQGDGSYQLYGSKVFISNAGGGFAFILAKTPGHEEGLKSLSMFFAEHLNEDGSTNFEVTKNEEKMGMHGSFTCEVLFDGTKAYLVGEEGEGFQEMLQLMNEARICTGAQALGGIEAALSYAENYAKERTAFGQSLNELPLMKKNLGDWATERDAIRALIVDTASHYDIYHVLGKKLDLTNDLNKEEMEEFKKAKEWVIKRTPLIKYYATEANLNISSKALTVLGGHGYMIDHPMERYARDSYAPILYEGTSQIQSLMAMKDLMKYATRNPQAFFSSVITGHPTVSFAKRRKPWERDYQNISYDFKKNVLKLIIKCLKPENTDIFKMEKWQNNTDGINELMTHAETLCQGLSYLETLQVLSKHASIDDSRHDLYQRYRKLVEPRFQYIFSHWE